MFLTSKMSLYVILEFSKLNFWQLKAKIPVEQSFPEKPSGHTHLAIGP